ncbi:unnamed protein product [Nezara viridula]|uniref:Transposase n=1 Tax=Nezara viridula TaxID=85310 RepID=A0A9P0HKF1_NEZVI|nr:unnamed protein product [Nezara viridula]
MPVDKDFDELQTLKKKYSMLFSYLLLLVPEDCHVVSMFPIPANLSQRLIRQCTRDPNFLNCILVTDEFCFTRNRILNFRNTHTWAEENPHATAVGHYQHPFSLNVWCGVQSDIIGPFSLPPRLSGIRQRLWFMHDGAPAHFSNSVTDYLNATYGFVETDLLNGHNDLRIQRH